MIKDYMKLVWGGFVDRKLRSWLTMLGIFIGIAAVISLISLGQGLQISITQQFEELGSDKIIIQPRNAFASPLAEVANPLTKDDVDVIKRVKGINEISSMYYGSARVEYNDEIKYVFVSGIPTDEERKLIEQINDFSVESGRDLKRGDSNKVVVGYDYGQTKLFTKKVKLRDKILINDNEFEVVGILGRIGNPADDSSLLITDEAIRDLYNKPNEVSFIFASTSLGVEPLRVVESVENKLRNHRNLEKGKEDFEVTTPQQFLETLGTVLSIVQSVIVGIAAISLFVGGVGIMNTMYTSVLERTKEIGVMKAIGAKNRHIMEIFLLESAVYGLVGGSIGVVIGLGLAKGVEILADKVLGINLIQAYVSYPLIIGALLFAVIVGAVSGAAPAYRASRLRPVDALRYE